VGYEGEINGRVNPCPPEVMLTYRANEIAALPGIIRRSNKVQSGSEADAKLISGISRPDRKIGSPRKDRQVS
jgi:hypothetical protein